jgi:sulfite reductase (ferredoxin)
MACGLFVFGENIMAEQPKETKAQKVERLKRELNPWERLDEIREFARQGHGSIPAEWLSTYFRFWGIYTQGDGAGAIGGKGGEGLAMPFFMVRIRIPNGFLSSDQARTIASLCARYGRGVADITVRQTPVSTRWEHAATSPATSPAARWLGSMATRYSTRLPW